MKLYAKKEIVRKYYKYVDTPWTQPILTSNGTIGGDSFACSSSVEDSSYPTWKMFDGINSNFANFQLGEIIIYNNKKLKITNFKVLNRNDRGYGAKAYTIYGSNDNSNWTNILSGTNSTTGQGQTWNIDLSLNNNFYTYYKINVTNAILSSNHYQIAELTITATQQVPTSSTEDDYDFYKDVEVYLMPKKTVTKYWKYIYVDKPWTQPRLSSNGTLGGSSFAVYCPSDQTSSYPPYRAFDGSTSTPQVVTHSTPFTIYNPTPLNITKFQLTYTESWQHYAGGTIQGSNDNTNWENIVTIGANLTTWDLSSNTKYYNYYKILQPNGGDWQPREITLTATQQIMKIIEATEDDYDFTTQEDVYWASTGAE